MWEILAEFAHFETERLRLRPFSYSDGPGLYRILSSPTNTVFIHPQMESREACNQLLVQAFMRQPLGIWAIEDKQGKELIGSIRLENIQELLGQAEVGYFLREDYWGQGLATEAVDAIVFMSFHRLGLQELIIKTHAENIASQKVAQKAGFSLLRSYKGSDRYSRKMRFYKDYYYHHTDYQIKEIK